MSNPIRTLAILAAATLAAGCPDGTKTTVDDDGDGFTVDDGDCDDSDSAVNPGATELCGDGKDNDCAGGDALCTSDLDGDGYTAGAGDCDDSDPAVNPDGVEDCNADGDEDCNGIATGCPPPDLIYTPIEQGVSDSYGVGVFGDRVVFGDPAGALGQQIADGRAALFTFTPGGYVTENDAVSLSAGTPLASSAYGIVINPVGARLCISADYQDAISGNRDAGKSWCYAATDVSGAGASLDLAAADFTTSGSDSHGYATADAELDADGDGVLDLIVYSAQGLHVIHGTGAAWAGDYAVPGAASQTLPCTPASDWCGFARAYGTSAIAVSGSGGVADAISIYTLPLAAGAPAPAATYTVDRALDDSAVALRGAGVFAIGSSTTDSVYFIDDQGLEVGVLEGTGSFGKWVDVMTDQNGDELLLVGAPYRNGAQGRLFVFDVTAHGLPTSEADAIFELAADENQFSCGWRGRGGTVTDADSIDTVIAISCPGYGGAAFRIGSKPLPAPLVRAADVGPAATPNHWNIKRWVVNAYTGNVAWALSLTRTEAVMSGTTITGWRLHDVAVNSPLYRAGLRTGDVIKKVNDTAVTTPAVVRQLVTSLKSGTGATLRFTRAGVARTFTYHVIP